MKGCLRNWAGLHAVQTSGCQPTRPLFFVEVRETKILHYSDPFSADWCNLNEFRGFGAAWLNFNNRKLYQNGTIGTAVAPLIREYSYVFGEKTVKSIYTWG